jgi:hypothetical protein
MPVRIDLDIFESQNSETETKLSSRTTVTARGASRQTDISQAEFLLLNVVVVLRPWAVRDAYTSHDSTLAAFVFELGWAQRFASESGLCGCNHMESTPKSNLIGHANRRRIFC